MRRNKQQIKTDGRFILSIVLLCIEGLFAGLGSAIIFIAISAIFRGTFNAQTLETFIWIVVGVFALRIVIYAVGYTLGYIGGASVVKKMRLRLGEKLKTIPLGFYTNQNTGSLIGVMTTEMNDIEILLTRNYGDIVKTIALGGVTMAIIFYLDVRIALINCAVLLAALPLAYSSIRIVEHYGLERKNEASNGVSKIVEYIQGIQTFKAYGIGGITNTRLNNALETIRDTNKKFERKIAPLIVIYKILIDMGIPLTMLLGGIFFAGGSLSVEYYLILILIAIGFYSSIDNLLSYFTEFRSLSISKRAVDAIAQEKSEEFVKNSFEPEAYDIEFHDVHFSYKKGEKILKGLSLSARQGQITALVGDSGSGKTTICNLISKFYDPDTGSVTLGGKNLSEYQTEAVLDKISMVYQDVFLFNDTIMNNILFAKPNAARDEVMEACKLANCHEFIIKLENGYETMAGERGDRLSGGEKQRISIARAILKDSPILLLDEATSSLDIENELAVKQAICHLVQENKTIIIIAHSLNSIRYADQIIVLKDGKIIESGRHEALLSLSGKYAAMWEAERQLFI